MRRRWQGLRRRLLAVGLPVFSSPAGPRAFAGLGLLLGLLLTVNTLNVVNSYAGRDLMTAVAEGRQPGVPARKALLPHQSTFGGAQDVTAIAELRHIDPVRRHSTFLHHMACGIAYSIRTHHR